VHIISDAERVKLNVRTPQITFLAVPLLQLVLSFCAAGSIKSH